MIHIRAHGLLRLLCQQLYDWHAPTIQRAIPYRTLYFWRTIMAKPLYFFHGLESGPHGTKFRRLSADVDVVSPDFQGMDIWQRLDKAARLTEGRTDLIVVGSSFGGLLAALLYSRHPDRFRGYVLLAPALHHDAADQVERMPESAIVIHGTRDDVVPLEAVRERCAQHDVEVTEVDDDHRLHGSLEVMVEAVRRL